MNSPSPIAFQYRPELQLLLARWQDASTIDSITHGYQQLLTEARQLRSRRWLVDIRRRPLPTPDQAHWISHTWLPEAAAVCAPQRLRLAYLLSPTYLHGLTTNPALQPSMQIVLAPQQPYDLRTFIDEGEAMQWLQAAG